jgi:hypothetical protein
MTDDEGHEFWEEQSKLPLHKREVAASAVWHGCHTADHADGSDLPVSES